MSTYIAIRDDATSQSIAERDFIVQTAEVGLMRVDGRKRTERRPVSLALTRAENRATATVTLGAGTRVTCTVTADLLPPATDRPNEGSIAFLVDISPSSNTSYRQATPASTGGTAGGGPSGLPNADRHQKLATNHILRCLERCLLQGGALDTEALCVVPGSYVWKLSCCCTVLDCAGNMTDAAVLACLAAVRHYRKPLVELGADSAVPVLVPSNLKEPTPLPLHHTPLAISFALFDVISSAKDPESSSTAVLIDPTAREELCQTGSITICMNAHAEICLLDFSGGCELQLADLRKCHAQAAAHITPLCQSLETALEQADQQALAERLALLQKLPPPLPPLAPDTLDEPPFAVAASVVPTDPVYDQAAAAQDAATAAEEESYRRQALDYNLGHVATKVRENKETTTTTTTSSSKRKPASLLLAAMLQSVQGDVSMTERAAATNAGDDSSTPVAAPMRIDEPPPPPPRGKPQSSKGEVVAPAATPKNTTTTTKPSAMLVDSDEEETTMQLQSEFVQSVPATASTTADDDDDDSVDDLAAAIKAKPKGKKGKKK